MMKTTESNVRKELVRLVRSTDLAEAHQILATLKSMPPRIISPQLVALLMDKDASVRWRAADLLLNVNGRANLRHVLTLLNDRDPDVRASVCFRMAERAPSSIAVDPLCNALLHDRDSNVRFWAAHALGAYPNRKAIKALEQATSDQGRNYEDVPVAHAARSSLAAIAR